MTKKKAGKAKTAKPTVGLGKKQCPNCGEVVASAFRTCPHCQHPFAAKARQEHAPSVPETPPAALATNGVDVATIVAAYELIRRSGGIHQAKAALEVAERAAKESRAY